MFVGERRLVLEKSSRERWPPFPSNHPWKCSPFLPFILSLPPLLSYLRKEPRSRNKGGESDEETLILINCLIFLRDIRDALPPAGLVYISLDHRKDVVPSLRWMYRCIHDILLNDIVLLRNLYIIGETQRLFDAGFFIKKISYRLKNIWEFFYLLKSINIYLILEIWKICTNYLY